MPVHVVIPCYNSASFIGDCLDSLVKQTYENWQAVVVDDGSSDHSAQIVTQYAQTESRIRILRLSGNSGAAGARNAGIRYAHGELIAFLDADDMWFANKLERQVAFLEQHPETSLVGTDVKVVDASGVVKDLPRRTASPTRSIGVENFLFGSGRLATSSVLVKQDCLDAVGLFHEQYKIIEDFNLWFRIAQDHRIDVLQEPLVYYRVHDSNISRDGMTSQMQKIMMWENEVINDVTLRQQFGTRLRAHLQRMYWSRGKALFKRGHRQEARAFLEKAVSVGLKNVVYLKSVSVLVWLTMVGRGKQHRGSDVSGKK